MTPDQVNGLFEFGLSIMLVLNIVRLLKDKIVKGMDYRVVVFTTAWGIWNLFYYPNLGQWFSFAGGLFVVSANATWLGLLLHYKRKN